MEGALAISEVMSKKPVVVPPGTKLNECAKRMLKERVGSLLVEEHGVLLGILTEKDFVTVTQSGWDPVTTMVQQVMQDVVITIGPEQTIDDAVTLMAKQGVRRLPVVDAEQKLVGLITMNDVLNVQPQLFPAFLWKKAQRAGVQNAVAHDGECDHCGTFTMVHWSDAGWLCDECFE